MLHNLEVKVCSIKNILNGKLKFRVAVSFDLTLPPLCVYNRLNAADMVLLMICETANQGKKKKRKKKKILTFLCCQNIHAIIHTAQNFKHL